MGSPRFRNLKLPDIILREKASVMRDPALKCHSNLPGKDPSSFVMGVGL